VLKGLVTVYSIEYRTARATRGQGIAMGSVGARAPRDHDETSSVSCVSGERLRLGIRISYPQDGKRGPRWRLWRLQKPQT
jgi:hypothetical protein